MQATDRWGLNWVQCASRRGPSRRLRDLQVEFDVLTLGRAPLLKIVYRLINLRAAARECIAGLNAVPNLGGRVQDLVLVGADNWHQDTLVGNMRSGQRWGAVVNPRDGRAALLVCNRDAVGLWATAQAGRLFAGGCEARLAATMTHETTYIWRWPTISMRPNAMSCCKTPDAEACDDQLAHSRAHALPPDVQAAVGQQMINHRGAAFEQLLRETSGWLRLFFETEQQVYILTSSGTGAMEASIANTLSPGDRVLAISCGSFGDRYDEIARAYRADVTSLKFAAGRAVDPDRVGEAARAEGPFKAAILTHNETSTGVLNDVQAIAAAVRAAGPDTLIMVDSISGLGGARLQMDAWDVDVVLTGSQKAWMAPPGLAMIALSARAWRAYETAQNPRYYFDLGLARQYAARGQTPSTPALATLYGLHTALQRMAAEGVAAVAARHEALAAHCRERAWRTRHGALCPGRALFAHSDGAHPACRHQPDAVLFKTLVERYDIHCGSTKDPRVGVIRIGHMGYCSIADLDAVFAALGDILSTAS